MLFRLLAGRCKSWTLDSGLDHGLDYGLVEYGLNSRLIFKLLAMVASHETARRARNNTGELTVAAGRPQRQLSITKCLKMLHRVTLAIHRRALAVQWWIAQVFRTRF